MWLRTLSSPYSLGQQFGHKYPHVLKSEFCPPPFLPPPYVHLATSETWCWCGGRGILAELSPCYSTVYHYNGVRCYEQFSQVGQLDQAVILFGSALKSVHFQLDTHLRCRWTNDMELVPKQFAWAGHANWLFLLYTKDVSFWSVLGTLSAFETLFCDDTLYKI